MKYLAFQVSLFTMVFFGALDMSRGIAAPLMQHDWKLTYMQLGYAFVANSLGYLAGSFMSGFVADKHGIKPVMLVGGGLSGCGIAVIAGLHSYPGLMIGFLCMGVGNGWLEIAINSVVPAISKTSNDQAAYFNILHGFYGVGAFGFPVIAVWLIRVGGAWRFLYEILLGVCALIFLISVFLDLRPYQKPASTVKTEDSSKTSLRPLLRNPVLYLLLAGITAYVMAEGGIGSWLPTYLVAVRKLSVTASSYYLSGFYLTFTLGRLSGKFWVSKLGDIRSILLSTCLALVLTTGALFFQSALICFIFAGIGYSIVFPTIASIASHTFSDHSGKVLGFLFTAGGIGSLAVNWLIGFVSTRYGLATGFSMILIFLVLVLVSIGCIRVTARRPARAYREETFAGF